MLFLLLLIAYCTSEKIMLVLILHYSRYSDMHEIKHTLKYSLENYLSNNKMFVKINPVVSEITASKSLKETPTSALRSSEKLAVLK